MRAAALDIGTNTLLLTIGVWQENELHIHADVHRIARLGEGIGQSGTISSAALERAKQIVKEYRTIADRLEIKYRLAVGTSVFRRASNANEVAAELAEIWGAPIAVISGSQEAALTYYGTVKHNEHAAVLDIGGGSTELVYGSDGKIFFSRSIEIGAVRLAERYWTAIPASPAAISQAWEELLCHVADIEPLPPNTSLYAVAGTPTTLALVAQGIRSFDWNVVDGYILTHSELNKLWDRISRATYQELLSLPGVHPQRADILPAGTLILRAIVEQLRLPAIVVSARGLRHGVLRCFFEKVAGITASLDSTICSIDEYVSCITLL